ncbi:MULTISPECIES: hypothetical protein [unclassified Pseudomonas]|uniref:hypothetical protein n=1 Tax=unclassified Pseudomonas TaxID=196821 RepID=UPI00244BAD5B|nr:MULTISPECIES: hypothetical protein [unclassified Pseudomonas]MDH0300659.1 hypothetical protein [Pseudomonas sp. GD04091]MDH1984190.1 hypothetical protein [Pseudomonas sp. GD03689]
MPTENRSSNTEMVSDREMTECQFHNNCGGWCETRRELEHNLCEHCLESHDEEMSEPAHVSQPQGDLTAPYGWHVEWADSGDHYLFTKVEKRIEALRLDSDVKVVQLYTHADSGEVERLNLEIEKLRLNLTLNDDALIQDGCVRIENRDLRSLLADQNNLLREIKNARDWNGSYSSLAKKIDAALSASAEPSERELQALQAEKTLGIERLPAEPNVPVERDEPVAWFTDDHMTDKSATTWDSTVAERWRTKGWPVGELFARAALERKSS